MTDRSLIARIMKCLALSKSSNEHEAAAALAKARELMDEHGVTEEQLSLADIEEATARASRNLRPPAWESILAKSVCQALSVTCYIDWAGDRVFVGRGPSAEIASYAFKVLFRKLKGVRQLYVRTQLRRLKPGRKRQRADAYCIGWAAAVLRAVERLRPQGTLDPAIQRYLEVHHPGLVTVNSRAGAGSGRRTDADFSRGFAAGSAVEIGHGVASSNLAGMIANA